MINALLVCAYVRVVPCLLPMRRDLGLTSLSDSAHPTILLAVGAQHTWFLDAAYSGDKNGWDLLNSLSAEKSHLVLHQKRNTGTNEQRIALENVDIPQPSGFVQCEMPGEKSSQNIAEI